MTTAMLRHQNGASVPDAIPELVDMEQLRCDIVKVCERNLSPVMTSVAGTMVPILTRMQELDEAQGNFKQFTSLLRKYGNTVKDEHTSKCQSSSVSSKHRLYNAVCRGDTATVKALLLLGRSPNQRYDYCVCEDFRREPEEKDEGSRWSYPLHKAVEGGNPEIVKLLLDYGADVNVLDKDDCSPFHMLVDMRGGIFSNYHGGSILKMLATKGADVNARLPCGLRSGPDSTDTLLHTYCEDGDWHMAKALLEAGADPTLENEDGETALSLAAGCLDHYDDNALDSDDEITGYNPGYDVLGTMLEAIYTPEQKKAALGSFLRIAPNVRAVYHLVQVGAPVASQLSDVNDDSCTPVELCVQKADDIIKRIHRGAEKVTPSKCRLLVSWLSVLKLLLNAGAPSPMEQEGLKNVINTWNFVPILKNCNYDHRDPRSEAVVNDLGVCRRMLCQITSGDSRKGTLQEHCAVEIRKRMSPPQREIWENRLDLEVYQARWDALQLPKGVKEYVFSGDLASVLARYRQYERSRVSDCDFFDLCSSPESDDSYRWYAWWDHF